MCDNFFLPRFQEKKNRGSEGGAEIFFNLRAKRKFLRIWKWKFEVGISLDNYQQNTELWEHIFPFELESNLSGDISQSFF